MLLLGSALIENLLLVRVAGAPRAGFGALLRLVAAVCRRALLEQVPSPFRLR